jgi:hypothetical protein
MAGFPYPNPGRRRRANLKKKYRKNTSLLSIVVMSSELESFMRNILCMSLCSFALTCGHIQAMPAAEMMKRIIFDSDSNECIDYKVLGPYMKVSSDGGMFEAGIKVAHWYPVYVIELARSPGDSAFYGNDGSPSMSTRIATTPPGGGNKQAFEVRVWELPEIVSQYGGTGPYICASCYSGHDEPIYEQGGSKFGGIGASAERVAGAMCGAPSVIGGSTAAVGMALAKSGSALLVYSSEVDILHWRSGCRDMDDSFTGMNLASPLACGGQGIAEKLGASDLSDVCVGEWGPRYPRQYMSLGTTEPIGTGLSSARALDLAVKTIQIGKWKLGSKTVKYQQLYPDRGSCFKEGQSIAKTEKDMQFSKDGRYAFLVWIYQKCNVEYAEMYACGKSYTQTRAEEAYQDDLDRVKRYSTEGTSSQ